ncbi:DNA excision repair protein ERCC-6-like [Clytia hemisphaerica]|uniref:DNA excision repair protein ERCC-6 n=1 Tax=Clytia hemisphaerica TaxID=252671 RepID=A0A7M5XEH0_9CNID
MEERECVSSDITTSQYEEKTTRTISSYGIAINTEDLSKADVDKEDYQGLQALGINAYEQEDLENEVINQVNTAVSKAEGNFHQHATEAEIKNICDEIILLEKDIKEIETVFVAAKSGDLEASRKISFSLLQRKTGKESRLKLLQNSLKEEQEKLEILKSDSNTPATKQLAERDKLIQTGEITPFDAINLKNAANNVYGSITLDSIVDKYSQIKMRGRKKTLVPVYKEPTPIIPKISKRKELKTTRAFDARPPVTSDKPLRKRNEKKNFFTEESEDEEMDDERDEDFVPSENEFTEEEEKEFFEDIDQNEVDDLKAAKGGRKRSSKVVAKEKGTKGKKKDKIIDDGDFESYRERIRKHNLKEKLKEKIRKGEANEDDFDIEFSSDDDGEEGVVESENDEVTIQDDFTLPKKMWRKLYRYQRVGVKWLWQLHQQQVGGIIGDEMGLGKTIQMITFLHGLSNQMKRDRSTKGLGATLVVCPGTVLHQWVAEFHKWAPTFRVAILHDSGSFVGRKEALIKTINNHKGGILVTTYAGVRINKKELYRYKWHYVVLDEGHKIRNPDSEVTMAVKQIDTPHRIILTGTPMQNSLKELWSLFDFVFPGRLGTLPVFMAEFSVPITMGGYANATPVQVQTAHRCATVLKDTINPYMMRRLKKDVKMVINLPQKNEQVLFCKLTEAQKDMYEKYIKSPEVTNILQGRMKVFPGLIKLRKICNHPDLAFFEHNNSEDNDNITKSSDYGYWERSGKMLVVESLLKMWKEKKHRVLLFSQSKQMLDIMELFLQKSSYTYLRMDGETNIGSRQVLVKNFTQNTSIFVFLLTTRVGGLGLNLTAADRIIIFDPDWNPSTDTQARERAWRIGQDKHVTIYRLMTTGTIEEKIYHRQIFKQFLTNRVLANPFQRRFFKSNDLYELFSLDDIGPMQSTETGAIFAGTGSEIRMRGKKLKTKQTRVKNEISDETAAKNHNGVASEAIALGKQDKNVTNKQDIQTVVKKMKKSKKEKKQRKRRKSVEIDGSKVEHVDKMESYKTKEEEIEQDEKTDTKVLSSSTSEDDVLMSLFRSSGIHSALKHDKIEQSGNPDYVLVEKEAERVAKQAANALRQSRSQCRANGYSVPTWTGRNSSTEPTSQPAKKRFGKRTNETNGDFSTAPKIKKEEPTTGYGDSLDLNLDSEAIDVSSSALLARMRRRNMVSTGGTPSLGMGGTPQSDEDRLLKDIEMFVKCKPDFTATSDQLTENFKERLKPGQNALFKELLKQICLFKKVNGNSFWKLKDEFM